MEIHATKTLLTGPFHICVRAQNSPALKRLVLSLALGYCELCDGVIAPSVSMARFLTEHDVDVPVTVIPTGVEAARFDHGDGKRFRAKLTSV